MNNQKAQQRLNDYLKQIEDALSEISVADRSDILLELNSHISERLENGDQDIDQILAALGSPQQVANRYLLDRGIQPIPPKRFSWLKAFTLGTVGVLALCVIAMVMVIRSFTPLISVNEEEGRVVILGGMIDVNEKEGKVSLGKGLIKVDEKGTSNMEFDIDFDIDEGEGKSLAGDVETAAKKRVVIRGQNVKFEVTPSQSKLLTYNCKVGGLGSTDNVTTILDTSSKTEISFELPNDILKASKCKFRVPEKLEVKVDAGNGKVILEDLRQDVFVKLANGKVRFEKEPKTSYRFETKIQSGKVVGLNDSDFNNSDQKAYKIHLEATNGKIEVE